MFVSSMQRNLPIGTSGKMGTRRRDAGKVLRPISLESKNFEDKIHFKEGRM